MKFTSQQEYSCCLVERGRGRAGVRGAGGILCSDPSKPPKHADGSHALKIQDRGYQHGGVREVHQMLGVSWIGHGDWGHVDERRKALSLEVDLTFFMTMLGQG